jgi:hypothetical protein
MFLTTQHNGNEPSVPNQTDTGYTSPTPTTTTDPTDSTVYITRTGTKYHLAGCRHLKSAIPITLKDAKELGYTPCSVCGAWVEACKKAKIKTRRKLPDGKVFSGFQALPT